MNLPLRSFVTLIQVTVCLFCLTAISRAEDQGSDKAAEKSKAPSFDREKLIGKWKHIIKGDGMVLIGTTELKKDGTMQGRSKLTLAGKTITISMDGTWKLNGDILEETVTKSSHPELIPVGTVTKDKVLKLSDTEFTYEDEDGEEETETRVVEKPDESKSI